MGERGTFRDWWRSDILLLKGMGSGVFGIWRAVGKYGSALAFSHTRCMNRFRIELFRRFGEGRWIDRVRDLRSWGLPFCRGKVFEARPIYNLDPFDGLVPSKVRGFLGEDCFHHVLCMCGEDGGFYGCLSCGR